MIARDEEKVIRRCLESVQGLVDEIIVVDTGSMDSTKEIALEFTDKVFDFTWVNDFSAAKNEAIRKATSKWILILDADEYVQPDKHEELREMLMSEDHTKPKSFILPIFNILNQSKSGNYVESFAARIINNHPDVYFYRPIHEQVIYAHGEIPTPRYSFSIFHTGYTKETKEAKNKSERNLSIFTAMGKQKKFEEYDYYTLGNEYDGLQDYKKALYYYKRADTKRTYNQAFIIHCKFKIISISALLGYFKEAIQMNEECLTRWPQYVDFHYLKGNFYEHFGMYENALQTYKHCISLANQNSKDGNNYWLLTPAYGSIKPYKKMLSLHIRMHNYQETVSDLIKLIELKCDELTHLYLLIQLLSKTDGPETIIGFLDKLLPENEPANQLRLFQASLLAAHSALSKYYYEKCMASGILNESTYHIQYAILTNNKKGFIELMSSNSLSDISSKYNNHLVALASMAWHDKHLLDSSKSVDSSLIDACRKMIDGNSDQIKFNSQEDLQQIGELLADLFKYGYYEAYDYIIQLLPDQFKVLANSLGNYFYSQGHLELALDYYDTLIQKDELSAQGYENIAQLYLNQGDSTGALEFLKKAIELSPKNIPLYIQTLSLLDDPSEKQIYKRLFMDHLPEHKGVPIIRHLLA